MPKKTTIPGKMGRPLLGDKPLTAAERAKNSVARRRAAGFVRRIIVIWEKEIPK